MMSLWWMQRNTYPGFKSQFRECTLGLTRYKRQFDDTVSCHTLCVCVSFPFPPNKKLGHHSGSKTLALFHKLVELQLA